MSRCLFSIHAGILNSKGLLTTATILFTSSVVSSPARLFKSMSHFLHTCSRDKLFSSKETSKRNSKGKFPPFPSPSHFLFPSSCQNTMFEIRRPIPRMAVSANITFWRPSTLVLHIPRLASVQRATKQPPITLDVEFSQHQQVELWSKSLSLQVAQDVLKVLGLKLHRHGVTERELCFGKLHLEQRQENNCAEPRH